MTASRDDWPSGPPEWSRQRDRDEMRDRLKDAEHTLVAHGEHLTQIDHWKAGTDTKLSWQTAAIGFLAWTILNKTLSAWTPELADLVATALKGLLR
jgi:hypothetical protein